MRFEDHASEPLDALRGAQTDRGYTTLKRELDATALSIARVQKHYGSTARKGCRRGITGLRNHRDVVCVEDDTQVCAPADISYETHFLPHRLTH